VATIPRQSGAFPPLVDRLLVYSNASDEGDATLIAQKSKGALEVLDPDALPEVTQRLRALSIKPQSSA